MRKNRIRFSTTHMIMISFLFAVIVGSILLFLPISTANGEGVSYIDALFTATTCICVTGLVTVPTVSTWSTFGHIVMLALIQIGGLGIITIMSRILVIFRKKFGIRDRILIQDAFNLNSMSGVVRFLKKVMMGTFIVEGIGALLYMTVFVPQFGLKGIWISIFNSVSAFCNAGIDIISENSLCDYSQNPMINTVTSLLIIIGGIGFIVWWELIRAFRELRSRGLKAFSFLSLHTKLSLSVTGILLLGGAAAFFIFEYNNPNTIGSYSLFDKLQASFFQSVTTRTAGFASISQKELTNPSAVFSLLLMFIGGSPVGTAGGVKTTTVAVVALSALAAIKNKNEVTMFRRTIPKHAISKAVAVVCTSFMIMFVSTVLLAAVTDASVIDIAFETVSATATVGLTRDLTPTLNLAGKIIIIITMYLGRVGPISLLIAFNLKKSKPDSIKDPIEDIHIG